MALNDSSDQGGSSGGFGGQPGTMRIIMIAAAVVIGIPTFFVWGWTLDRIKTNRAVGRALDKGEQALKEADAVQALIAFNHARELRPSDPFNQHAVWRARALLIAQNADRLTAENIEEVRSEVPELVEEDAKNSAIYLTAWGHVLLRRGDNAGAEQKLSEAVKADPKNVVALLARADFLQKTTNKADDAIKAYQDVLAVDPNNFAANFGLGRLYVVKKDPAKEIDFLKKAVSVKDDYSAHEALGDAYLHAKNTKDALPAAFKEYRAAAAINPGANEPHWGLGMIYSQANQWGEAEKELRLAMRGKHNSEVEFQLGLALMKQNKFEEAMPLFLQFLRENPKHPAAMYEIGNAAAALHQDQTAAGFYRQVLSLPLPDAVKDPSKATERQQLEALQKDVAERVKKLPAAPARPAR